MGIGDRLLGNPAQFSFEQRIFHLAMLMGIVLTAFGTGMDVYYRGAIWADTAFLGCWVLFYLFSRYRQGFAAASICATVLFLFAFIPYTWMLSGGLNGSIPHYTILFMAIIAMILHPPFRKVMILSLLALVLLLIAHEIYINHLPLNTLFGTPIHLIVILAATALLIIVYSNTYMKEKQRSEAYANELEAHMRQQAYYVQTLEQLLSTLKSERHDFNNHLSVIHGLLEGGETHQAAEYTAKLVRNAVEYQTIVFVPYAAVRAIINHKLSVARQNGVALKLDVNLPEGLAIHEFDLAAILGNLLDNAMEACALLTDIAPYISLTLRYKPNYIVLRIANPYCEEAEQARHENREEPENHGFGLKNVRYIVEKHNGFMELKQEGGVFEADIALLAE